MKQEIKNQIESIIDSNSLNGLLAAIAEICQEKGTHIRENWQDRQLAIDWENAGKKIFTLSTKIDR